MLRDSCQRYLALTAYSSALMPNSSPRSGVLIENSSAEPASSIWSVTHQSRLTPPPALTSVPYDWVG